MTTITKEWLQQTIAEFENTRDDIPFGLDDDDAKILIVLKRALASLEREQIRREHAEWSDATFGNVGPVGPLKHLSKEALEAAADPSDPLEWADMQFLLWDAQRRMGISDEFITRAMIEKLAVNKQREWPEPKDGEPRLHIKEQPAPVMPAELHPDTQNLVADFCTALAEKLYKAQLKYGYDADWKQDGWATQCLSHFHQHIAKGDPRDVAAYCAFMWYHGWKTESVSVPVVPEECPADISVLMASHSDSLFNDDDAQEIWNACRAAMLQSKYRDLSQPADPQISEYEKIMGQAGMRQEPVAFLNCSGTVMTVGSYGFNVEPGKFLPLYAAPYIETVRGNVSQQDVRENKGVNYPVHIASKLERLGGMFSLELLLTDFADELVKDGNKFEASILRNAAECINKINQEGRNDNKQNTE